jgi:hypothetical protein
MAVVTRIEPGEAFSEKTVPSDAVVPFSVVGSYTARAAIGEVKSTFGDIGTLHPEDQAGRLRSVQYEAVERIGSGPDRGWVVFVRFSVDGAGANFEEPTVTEPTYVTAEYSTLERTIKAPYYFKRPVTYPTASGTTTGFEWDLGTQEFVISGLQLRVVVNVIKTQYTLGAFSAAQDQTNKLHRLPNGNPSERLWQYLGAQSSQVSADLWQVTHEWWSDPGNDAPPKPTNLANQGDIISAPARLPFEDYSNYTLAVVPPGGFGALYVPVIDVYSPFEEDADGFNSLPGDPIGRVVAS